MRKCPDRETEIRLISREIDKKRILQTGMVCEMRFSMVKQNPETAFQIPPRGLTLSKIVFKPGIHVMILPDPIDVEQFPMKPFLAVAGFLQHTDRCDIAR